MTKSVITIEIEKNEDVTKRIIKLNEKTIFEERSSFSYGNDTTLMEVIRRAIIETNS